jgi:AcrR family transcriptional regulator
MDLSHLTEHSPAMQRGNYQKRCAIITAATAVFVRDGYVGASIDAIADKAGVSRQTIYNQIGDKEKLFAEVVRGINERSSAALVATLTSFPDKPDDLETELTAFAIRMTSNCLCDDDARTLRRLIENEGQRYPELFDAWKDYGPGRDWPAIAARFARLAHSGAIEADNPELAARQFMALISADLPNEPGRRVAGEQVEQAARNGVKTFLRAFGTRPRPPSDI